jgi:hypothetical protein
MAAVEASQAPAEQPKHVQVHRRAKLWQSPVLIQLAGKCGL